MKKKKLLTLVSSVCLILVMVALLLPACAKEEAPPAEEQQEVEVYEFTLSEAELDKVKINTKAEFIYSLESSSSVAGLYGDYYVKGNIKPLLEYVRPVISHHLLEMVVLSIL